MGLFSDKCPECGNIVSKRARFCSKCGRGAPDGWFKCPQCGKWVGNESKYCPHCDHPLFPEERIDLAGGVWARKSGEFATRFELDDVRFIKENGLMVQEGTIAVLLDGGKQVAELGPGRHSPLGTLRTINWFGNPPPRSAIMVDSGECVFRVDFTGTESGVGEVKSAALRSAEELVVGCVAEITLKFVPSKAVEFVANVMKESRSVTMKDVCQLIYENALTAVRDMCAQSKIEDLVKDPERRERFEDAITHALEGPMQSWGLEIIRTGAVEFFGPEYEKVRAKWGELEAQRRLVEFSKAQLELLAQDAEQEASAKKRDTLREQEMHEFLEQVAQEKQLSEIERTKALEIAVRVAKGEVSIEEAKQAAARELEEHANKMTVLAHKLELDLTLRNYDREQAIKDAEHKAKLSAIARSERLEDEKSITLITGEKLSQAKINDEIERVRIAREVWEADKWLDVRARKNKIANDTMRDKLDVLSGRDAQSVAAVLSGEGDSAMAAAVLKRESEKDALAHAETMAKIQAGLSSDQILAGGAAKDPNAAKEAYARAKEAAEGASAKVLDERRKMDAERLAHDEKLESQVMGLAEKAIEKPTTVVQPPAPVTNMQH